MGSAWDREPSERIRKIRIEKMRRLGLVLSDMCYIAVNAYAERKKRPITHTEIIRVMETELDLIVEENIEDESWREMIFKMALDKYNKQNTTDPDQTSLQ